MTGAGARLAWAPPPQLRPARRRGSPRPGWRAPIRAGIAVSPATAARVPSTAASQPPGRRDGHTLPAPFATANSPMPSGMPRRAPGSAGSTCAADSPALTCCGVAPRARASAAGLPGVQHRRPGGEDRVDRRQGDQHDREDQQHLLIPARRPGWSARRTRRSALWPAVAWKASTATIAGDRDRDAGRAEQRAARAGGPTSRSPSSSGTGSRGRERDQPGPAPRRPGRVGQRADRAGPRGADGRVRASRPAPPRAATATTSPTVDR